MRSARDGAGAKSVAVQFDASRGRCGIARLSRFALFASWRFKIQIETLPVTATAVRASPSNRGPSRTVHRKVREEREENFAPKGTGPKISDAVPFSDTKTAADCSILSTI
jgi:hypothetical protein